MTVALEQAPPAPVHVAVVAPAVSEEAPVPIHPTVPQVLTLQDLQIQCRDLQLLCKDLSPNWGEGVLFRCNSQKLVNF